MGRVRRMDVAERGEKGGRKRVAVGTTIADRPPRGSVRALLTHTALTSDDGVNLKHGAHSPDPGTRLTRTVPGACGSVSRSPWFAPFPPPPPRRLAPRCSAASSVLRRDPTPLQRTRPACGIGLPGPVPPKGTPKRSPGSRACSCSACLGSTTTRDHSSARANVDACVAFPTR